MLYLIVALCLAATEPDKSLPARSAPASPPAATGTTKAPNRKTPEQLRAEKEKEIADALKSDPLSTDPELAAAERAYHTALAGWAKQHSTPAGQRAVAVPELGPTPTDNDRWMRDAAIRLNAAANNLTVSDGLRGSTLPGLIGEYIRARADYDRCVAK